MKPVPAGFFLRRCAPFSALLACCLLAGAAELSPPATPVLTDRHGRALRAYSAGAAAALSEPVPLEELSPWLVLATLAAEDRRFFAHPGVDLRAVGRAVLQNAREGRTVSGASTITQQLSRALKPRPKTLLGKLGEMFSALRLESGHSKEEILEGYLNSVSYGNRTAGAQAAARAYFGIPARDLTLAQSAALAGVPKSPVLYDPVRKPGAWSERKLRILKRMLELGYIDGESYRLASLEKVEARLRKPPFAAPQFCDHALSAIQRGGSAGMSGGKRRGGGSGAVRTTLDLALQEHAASALANQLAVLSRRHNVTNGAVLALDNRTGGVLAWVGSADFFDTERSGQVDGVTAPRQPGSALKPFLYALAFSKGFRASDLVDDEPLYAAGGHTPLNYDKKYHGKVRLREALACSYNVPAVRLAEKTGPDAFLDALKRFGFDSLDKPARFYGAGLALGNGEVTLLELVNAYAALARGGIWLPVAVEEGMRPAPGLARRAIGAGEAALVADILSDNSARAGAFGQDSPLNLPFPFAAKTGTTKDYRDNWAVGFTPEWTVGVWTGNFDGSPMRRVSGITGAAPVLREAALKMRELYGSSPFRRPLDMRSARVCAESGLPPSPSCPSVYEELYLSGKPPSGVCALHGGTAQGGAAPAPQRPSVKYPVDGDIFRIDPNTPAAAQALFLKASVDDPGAAWFVDSRELAERGPRVPWPLRAGSHRAYFTVERGGRTLRSAPVKFTVVR